MSAPDRLTDREREVVISAALGNTHKETAERLGITYQTVKNHVGTAIAKYGARNLHELVYKLGWFDPDPDKPGRTSVSARPNHAPGDSHEYDLICRVCGTPGVIRLLIDPPVAS